MACFDRRRLRRAAGAAALAAGLCPPPAVPAADEERPSHRAGPLLEPLRIDGVLDEPDWARAAAAGDLVMVEPDPGAPPSAATIVKVLAGPKGVAFGVWCRDPDPAGIVSFTKQRDGDLRSEDHVRLVLDTFQDGRTGYVFAVNPGGARYDALVSGSGETDNPSWDGIWEAAARRDPSGWVLEVWIPIQTLRFAPRLHAWYFNLERRIQRLQETDRWASPRVNYAVTQTSRAGLLVGLPDFDVGLGLSLTPSLIGGFERRGPSVPTDFDGDAALDLRQRLGANLEASLTVNTDFAETETDTRQTNLTRFPLLFPEKRAFFLEGADTFEFGVGLGEDVVPFFSRRIGLVEGREVGLLAGAKITGRLGETSLGALGVRTRRQGGLAPATTLGVLRLKRNVLGESWVGFLGTAGDPLGRDGSWLGGVDLTYHTSRLGGDKNFLVGLWGLALGREDVAGDRTAVGLSVDYPNDRWDAFLAYKRIGEGFQPSLGFVPRPGIQRFDLSADFQPRPGWRRVRQMFFELGATLVTDLSGRWESYRIRAAPVNWRLESGDRIELNVAPAGERLTAPFEIAEGVAIPPGPYGWWRYRVEVEAAAKRRLSGQLTWWFGGFYGGTLHEIAAQSAWTPSPLVTFLLTAEVNLGRLPQGDFDQELFGVKARLNLSPDLQLDSFVQYDNRSRSVGTNTRLRWTFDPRGELFVVYNHNLRRIEDRFRLDSNELLVKLRYTLRR
jgi:Domain of unknown function (DUF5916)